MMQKDRKLPIGVQSFVKLREEHYLYVDKTEYVYRLVHSGVPYFLSRPRRFGKSLLLSTMRAYWEGKKELFTGLKIEDLEKDNPEAWQVYPVFYFDFNGKNYQDTDALEMVLDTMLREWEKVYGGEESQALETRFKNLLRIAHEKTGKRCVVLVDEYDKLLLETMGNVDLLEHNKAVFRGFFGNLKTEDEHIQFTFITGVTKFSKVSIFSDLNQLRDISLDREYSGICGITDEELEEYFTPEMRQIADEHTYSLEECRKCLKQMYDGYRFHEKGVAVYNPFSILTALASREMRTYWFSTGTPTFLVRRLKEISFDVQSFTNGTLYASKTELSDYRNDDPNPVPLLYQTGYLTIRDSDDGELCLLAFPNDEVRYAFLQNLLPEYINDYSSGTGKDIFALRRHVENGDTEGIRKVLVALFASISYNTNDTPFEHYFQTVIYLVFTLLGKYTACELHTNEGRIDCVVEAKHFVYVFEFKRDATAEEAMKQIEKKHYADVYAADNRKLYRIGVNFSSESRQMDGWIVVNDMIK